MLNDEDEAEKNFQDLENEASQQEEEEEYDSDSEEGPPLQGENLLDQIAEIETREVRNKLGLS